ncbi:glutamyl aminopeptidase [Scaptodrosophila lebanonensis]|uniref:Aminopeptidase n=1 Tax=Drosophila lebanonensis TaxID=7225 RepID=A0A6J2T5V6_DROLE|nr:glutamyl aminopeptidase [Scaptodrosophila lebanonensis]
MLTKAFYLRLAILCALVYLNTARTVKLGQNAKQSISNYEEIGYRLPTTLQPTHYKIYWNPDLESGKFTGKEDITVDVLESTKQIVLHSNNLVITGVYVQFPSGSPAPTVADYELDVERDLLIINMVEELPVEKITLGILFEGEMLNKLTGLYSSIYQTPAGETRTIATTKFEATYARQAFPCFDEPAFKATYQITVSHPTDSYHALSNMDVSDTLLLGDVTETIFETSVPMSTYLACIIVSDFESKSKNVDAQGIGDDFTMRAFATPHQLDKVQFALDFGVAVTEHYIQYYKVAYPLPKLDMAAIPDFASNAMEHWGLVTYRETALLYDENYSSTANKQSTASVLAHEIAHMWFGNLVTMKWWNDIWLNEGFARYMQYKGVHAVYPEWDMLNQFCILVAHPVLNFDAKLSSHPIVQPVETPSQITAIFDTISYDKGASVIRMLENLVGAEIFEEAVTNYLNKYQFSNAETDDFISEVAALVSSFDVKVFMRTWTEQMGYPVVEVHRHDDTTYEITQKRFLSNNNSYAEVPDDSEFGYKWSIPLTFMTDTNSGLNSFLFEYFLTSLTVKTASPSQWIKVNIHQVGYYRVNYEESLWKELIEKLIDNPTSFDTADRANLLNDAFALADAAQLSYNIALELIAYLPQERDFVPWYVAAEALKKLQTSLMYSQVYVDYLNHARVLLQSVYADVGWTIDADNHLRNRLRVSVLSLACAVGLPDCLSQAAQRFNTWLEDPTSSENIPAPDLRSIVYYYGMQQGNEASWERLLNLFQLEQDASEKLKLMNGLAGVQDPQLLYRLLELGTDESIVRSQDYFTLVGDIAGNPIGEAIVWDYYREHWPELLERFGLTNRYLGRLIATITKNFASNVKLEELQQFFNKYPEAGAGESSRLEALETVKLNIQWLKNNIDDISNWLQGTSTPL